MSDEFTQFRNPTPDELRLIAALAAKAQLAAASADWLAQVEVRPLADEGMGSLQLKVGGKPWHPRKFDRQVAELSFLDADNVPVLAAVNVDASGEPIEVDVWKADFSPLRRIPSRFADEESSG